MDEEREEGGPTSKTTLSGGYGCHSKTERKKREKQKRADSIGLSHVSMSDQSKTLPIWFEDVNQSTEQKRVKQARADPPEPSGVSRRSDRSLERLASFGDGNQPTEPRRIQQERENSPGPSCVSMKSDQSMKQPLRFQSILQSIKTIRSFLQQTSDSPGPSRVSKKSDLSMKQTVRCGDGNQSTEQR
ncbi:unnamed protein product [Gadus morhua 'NCC']